jgi:hypothetical protein
VKSATLDTARDLLDSSAAEMIIETVADALCSRGFDVRNPAKDESSYLRITNVRGTLCELTIHDSGVADWEYRSCDGSQPDPTLMTTIAMCILDPAPGNYGPVPHDPHLTLKGMIGRALADQGMLVSLHVLDTDRLFFDVYAEIAVTNPAQRDRGTIRVSDDGAIWWQCRILQDQESCIHGLELGEIADTIARALTTAHGARTE